jgi:hypothetical protein
MEPKDKDGSATLWVRRTAAEANSCVAKLESEGKKKAMEGMPC